MAAPVRGMTARSGHRRESVDEIEHVFDRLWPLPRSLTGPGVRATLDILSELHPLQRIEVPSGTRVFDWTVPDEWRVASAYLVAPDGRRFADFHKSNLHLVGYSRPFRGRMSLAELQPHLHSLPDRPTAIPYRTSYYEPHWGFCLADAERRVLPEGEYQVVVDTEFVPGSLTIGEAVLPGETEQEILLSTYVCHPSLANNELSGPLALGFLMRRLAARPSRRFTYRFVFAPETIGSITYLSLRGDHLKRRCHGGYVLTCCGDAGAFTYKRSRRGEAASDRIVRRVLKGKPHKIIPFQPDEASDERIYNSPGFDLPIGSIMRTMYGRYPEYHTSLDDKSVISFPALQESIDVVEALVDRFEERRCFALTAGPEPQLGRRGLYPSTAEAWPQISRQYWLLHYADGGHDLADVAEMSGHSLQDLEMTLEALLAAGLIRWGGETRE
jgi:aminopeptidase-like protein